MISYPIEKTPEKWKEIVGHIRAGHPVNLTENKRVVATVQPAAKRPTKRATRLDETEDDRRLGVTGTKLAAMVLEPEDFSGWEKQ